MRPCCGGWDHGWWAVAPADSSTRRHGSSGRGSVNWLRAVGVCGLPSASRRVPELRVADHMTALHRRRRRAVPVYHRKLGALGCAQCCWY
jgi:hypothetical protein